MPHSAKQVSYCYAADARLDAVGGLLTLLASNRRGLIRPSWSSSAVWVSGPDSV